MGNLRAVRMVGPMTALRIALVLVLLSAVALSQDGGIDYRAFYSSFAPLSCCWSNQCCWPIEARDVQDLGDATYRILASGQIMKRTGYSPDGRYHRCACDLQPNGSWKVWPGAYTRCLFTPSQGS